MKRLVVLLIVSCFTVVSFAKKSDTKTEKPAKAESSVEIKGKVVDFNTGEALVGVEITLEGTDTKAYTDFDGDFVIKNVNPGECNLIASYISYEKSYVEKLNVEKNNQVDIKLRESN